MPKTDSKEALLGELKLKMALSLEGVSLSEEVSHKLREKLLEQAKGRGGSDPLNWTKYHIFPLSYTLDHGFDVILNPQPRSPYALEEDGGQFYVHDRLENTRLSGVTFREENPKYYEKTTRDGEPMWSIAQKSSGNSPDKSMVAVYSTECSVKDQNQTCLFCCINDSQYEDGEQHPWRNPEQVGETVKAAYDEGFKHVTITGGFIPERREVEYYLDVAESIKEELGTETFNGTACIGAPLDLHAIERYKEAGFSTIAFNTEVWGKQYFDIVCPGKVAHCGGYDHWIKALEYAVQVFGKGRVRSNFVVGLQPKEVLFEGLDYLASIGVVTIASSWYAADRSPLAGHRTPTVEWHWDAQVRHAALLRKYGRTYEELFNASPSRFYMHDLFQIEDGTHPAYQAERQLAAAR